MIAKKDRVKIKSDNFFPVVGIGASAGGLDAFKRLLKAIPEDSGMAYIIVQHLDPSHESILTSLLQKATAIPVQEITDNIVVVENHIYIIPANKLLTATDGILQLSERLPKNHKNMPIDLLFASLAEVHQSHAIGVVLSGTGSDGTIGLKAIRDAGGITIAQDQESAAFRGMPQSAIDAEVVDFILMPESIPTHLLAVNEALKINADSKDGNGIKMPEEEYKEILSLLYGRRGVDFIFYKQATILRRITRRIALSMKGGIHEYLLYLKENLEEQDLLFQDLLIPVTQFFRDTKVFEAFKQTVFPALTKNKQWTEPLRIWIAGCSTGEEAYSFVMSLHEFLGEKASNTTIQVFATDISDIAIAKARTGIYQKNEVAGLSEERLRRFFTKTDGKFRLNKSIRDSCVFAYHNFLKDPPFAKIDLISCRNALIYVEPLLQKAALTTFHYALKEKGFLVLGKSETATQASDLYSTFDKNAKIYTPKAVRGNFLHAFAGHKDKTYNGIGHSLPGSESIKDDFQKNADAVILSQYAPPGVIVNNEMDVVQFRGSTSNWLEQPPGKPTMNLLKLAREGLAFELRNALYKAKKTKERFIKENIIVHFKGGVRHVTVEVIPLDDASEAHFLVLFKEISSIEPEVVEKANKNKKRETGGLQTQKDGVRIEGLLRELAQGRENMRNISEDQEASNEELQSANEELLSGSEELQSLNEELETSKEEIQTTNEELIIVNQELNDRNEQLNASRLYAESIVATIREPIIILSKTLQVRTANKAFYQQFQTTADETEGKLLFDLGNNQWDIPELRKLLEQMLPEKGSIVDFELSYNLPSVNDRIMLLNAGCIFSGSNKEESILVAVEDITEKRKIDDELKLFAEKLEQQVIERTASLHESNIGLQHSNKNLEQFAYVASHDLQEPLRKIRTFSTLLQDKFKKELPKEGQELITKINNSTERMSVLIKEILNFSQSLNTGIVFEKTDISDIVNNIINDFELLIREKSAVVECERLPALDAIPLQINQLFYNLISNSLKFSRKNIPPVITITSRMLDSKEVAKHKALNPNLSFVEISVADNGIGFDQQYSKQIFSIFQRLHTREQYSGTGIGLALCKTIAVNHHGEIYATSKENEGAVFKIILPLKHV
ncbi:MAG: chemotaxis protein CheB [Ferruginibacter sp.]